MTLEREYRFLSIHWRKEPENSLEHEIVAAIESVFPRLPRYADFIRSEEKLAQNKITVEVHPFRSVTRTRTTEIVDAVPFHLVIWYDAGVKAYALHVQDEEGGYVASVGFRHQHWVV